MGTNSFDIADVGIVFADSVVGSVGNGLNEAREAIIQNGYFDDIGLAIAAILAAGLFIVGLWVVVRRLLRAFRSTR